MKLLLALLLAAMGCAPASPSKPFNPKINTSEVEQLDALYDDIDAFDTLLRTSWANRFVHERLERWNLRQRLARLKADWKASPPRSTDEAYLRLKRFAASLHDGHLYTLFPQAHSVNLRSGMRFSFSKQGLILRSCERGCEGLVLPLVVEQIDGTPAKTWMENYSTLLGHSTVFGRLENTRRSLMQFTGISGEEKRLPTTLSVRVTSRDLREVDIRWEAFAPQASWPAENPDCITSRVEDRVLVVRVRSFVCRVEGEEDTRLWDERFNSQMEAALDLGERFDRILVDLRGNGGGMSGHAVPLAARFLSSKTLYYRSRNLQAADRTIWDTFADPAEFPSYRNDAALKTKPLWLLTDGGCFSQCSLFVIALVDAKRAKVIGTPIDAGAGGGSSELWAAPSGLWKANVPPWETYSADGSFIEGRYLKPDIETLPTLKDFRKFEDAQIKNAVRRVRRFSFFN